MANSLSELRETELSSVDIGLPRVLVHAPYEWVNSGKMSKAVSPTLDATHAAVVQLGSQANTNRSRIASESQHGWG